MDAVEFHPFINDTEKVFAGQFTDQTAHCHTVCSYNRGNLLMCVIMAQRIPGAVFAGCRIGQENKEILNVLHAFESYTFKFPL